MRKFLITSAGLAGLVGTALLLMPPSRAQFPLGSRMVDLTPAITTNVAITGNAPVPLGKTLRVNQRLLGVCKITSAPTGGSGQLLDIYYQYSPDDGATWQDFAHVQQSGTGTFLVPVSVIAAGPTAVPTASDGALSANTVVQGPLGDRLRIKYSASFGTSSGNWSFQAFVTPD